MLVNSVGRNAGIIIRYKSNGTRRVIYERGASSGRLHEKSFIRFSTSVFVSNLSFGYFQSKKTTKKSLTMLTGMTGKVQLVKNENTRVHIFVFAVVASKSILFFTLMHIDSNAIIYETLVKIIHVQLTASSSITCLALLARYENAPGDSIRDLPRPFSRKITNFFRTCE